MLRTVVATVAGSPKLMQASALDRIALSRDIALRGQGVMREGGAPVASDHLPLWADIEIAEVSQ